MNIILNFENRWIRSRNTEILKNLGNTISQKVKKWNKLKSLTKCHILGCLLFMICICGCLAGALGSTSWLDFGISWDFEIRISSFWIKSKNMDLSLFSKIPHSAFIRFVQLFNVQSFSLLSVIQIYCILVSLETSSGTTWLEGSPSKSSFTFWGILAL